MLTDRERQVYDFIRAYVARHGYAPKLNEIGQQLGIHSRGTVHRHVRAVREAGLIAVEPERSRGIRLRRGKAAAVRPYVLPLLGRIAAGRPIEAIPGEDEIDLSEFFVNSNRFVLKVMGDSMIEDGILDGDMVIVEKREHAENGDIVVALIDGEEATSSACRRTATARSPCARPTAGSRPCATPACACASMAWSSGSSAPIASRPLRRSHRPGTTAWFYAPCGR